MSDEVIDIISLDLEELLVVVEECSDTGDYYEYSYESDIITEENLDELLGENFDE